MVYTTKELFDSPDSGISASKTDLAQLDPSAESAEPGGRITVFSSDTFTAENIEKLAGRLNNGQKIELLSVDTVLGPGSREFRDRTAGSGDIARTLPGGPEACVQIGKNDSGGIYVNLKDPDGRREVYRHDQGYKNGREFNNGLEAVRGHSEGFYLKDDQIYVDRGRLHAVGLASERLESSGYMPPELRSAGSGGTEDHVFLGHATDKASSCRAIDLAREEIASEFAAITIESADGRSVYSAGDIRECRIYVTDNPASENGAPTITLSREDGTPWLDDKGGTCALTIERPVEIRAAMADGAVERILVSADPLGNVTQPRSDINRAAGCGTLLDLRGSEIGVTHFTALDEINGTRRPDFIKNGDDAERAGSQVGTRPEVIDVLFDPDKAGPATLSDLEASREKIAELKISTAREASFLQFARSYAAELVSAKADEVKAAKAEFDAAGERDRPDRRARLDSLVKEFIDLEHRYNVDEISKDLNYTLNRYATADGLLNDLTSVIDEAGSYSPETDTRSEDAQVKMDSWSKTHLESELSSFPGSLTVDGVSCDVTGTRDDNGSCWNGERAETYKEIADALSDRFAAEADTKDFRVVTNDDKGNELSTPYIFTQNGYSPYLDRQRVDPQASYSKEYDLRDPGHVAADLDGAIIVWGDPMTMTEDYFKQEDSQPDFSRIVDGGSLEYNTAKETVGGICAEAYGCAGDGRDFMDYCFWSGSNESFTDAAEAFNSSASTDKDGADNASDAGDEAGADNGTDTSGGTDAENADGSAADGSADSEGADGGNGTAGQNANTVRNENTKVDKEEISPMGKIDESKKIEISEEKKQELREEAFAEAKALCGEDADEVKIEAMAEKIYAEKENSLLGNLSKAEYDIRHFKGIMDALESKLPPLMLRTNCTYCSAKLEFESALIKAQAAGAAVGKDTFISNPSSFMARFQAADMLIKSNVYQTAMDEILTHGTIPTMRDVHRTESNVEIRSYSRSAKILSSAAGLMMPLGYILSPIAMLEALLTGRLEGFGRVEKAEAVAEWRGVDAGRADTGSAGPDAGTENSGNGPEHEGGPEGAAAADPDVIYMGNNGIIYGTDNSAGGKDTDGGQADTDTGDGTSGYTDNGPDKNNGGAGNGNVPGDERDGVDSDPDGGADESRKDGADTGTERNEDALEDPIETGDNADGTTGGDVDKEPADTSGKDKDPIETGDNTDRTTGGDIDEEPADTSGKDKDPIEAGSEEEYSAEAVPKGGMDHDGREGDGTVMAHGPIDREDPAPEEGNGAEYAESVISPSPENFDADAAGIKNKNDGEAEIDAAAAAASRPDETAPQDAEVEETPDAGKEGEEPQTEAEETPENPDADFTSTVIAQDEAVDDALEQEVQKAADSGGDEERKGDEQSDTQGTEAAGNETKADLPSQEQQAPDGQPGAISGAETPVDTQEDTDLFPGTETTDTLYEDTDWMDIDLSSIDVEIGDVVFVIDAASGNDQMGMFEDLVDMDDPSSGIDVSQAADDLVQILENAELIMDAVDGNEVTADAFFKFAADDGGVDFTEPYDSLSEDLRIYVADSTAADNGIESRAGDQEFPENEDLGYMAVPEPDASSADGGQDTAAALDGNAEAVDRANADLPSSTEYNGSDIKFPDLTGDANLSQSDSADSGTSYDYEGIF